MPDILKNEGETQRLRQALHQRIDRLPPASLAAADRALLEIEAGQLREELDAAFDKDEAEAKVSAKKVGEAIALHRARHPYAG